MSTRAPLTFKIASEDWEFELIHRLNYKTFVEEIPQHTPSTQLPDAQAEAPQHVAPSSRMAFGQTEQAHARASHSAALAHAAPGNWIANNAAEESGLPAASRQGLMSSDG